ncbi:CoA-binding protein [bacterium]|nr:CoA-binding protein [bacterium]
MKQKVRQQTVAVLGASPKPERYSNQAVRLLKENGHRVIPVNPAGNPVEGLAATRRLEDITETAHTLTVYVGPERGEALLDAMIHLKPGRVILNPGTESEIIESRLEENGIPVMRACTLVMLKTGQF